MQSSCIYFRGVLQLNFYLLVERIHGEYHQPSIHYRLKGLISVTYYCLIILTHLL